SGWEARAPLRGDSSGRGRGPPSPGGAGNLAPPGGNPRGCRAGGPPPEKPPPAPPQGSRAGAGKPQRWPPSLVRLGQEPNLVELPMAAAVAGQPAGRIIRILLGPEQAADAYQFLEPADPFLERDARRCELRLRARMWEARADARDQRPLAELVQRSDGVRKEHWLTQRREERRSPQPHGLGAGGDGREQGQRLWPRPGEERVAGPDRVVPCCLGQLGQGDEGSGFRMAGHDSFPRRQHKADAEFGVLARGRGGGGCLPVHYDPHGGSAFRSTGPSAVW